MSVDKNIIFGYSGCNEKMDDAYSKLGFDNFTTVDYV